MDRAKELEAGDLQTAQDAADEDEGGLVDKRTFRCPLILFAGTSGACETVLHSEGLQIFLILVFKATRLVIWWRSCTFAVETDKRVNLLTYFPETRDVRG